METFELEKTRLKDLPILRHFNDAQLVTTNNPLEKFRKGEKPLFNIFKLGLLGAIGYFSWVYVLPPVFQAIGQVLAIAGTVVAVGFLILAAPVIFKGLRRFTRFLHKNLIKHDPFGELEEQKDKMKRNKDKFIVAQSKIKKLKSDMFNESAKSKKKAEELQEEVVSSKNRLSKIKTEQEKLAQIPEGKISDKYVQNHTNLIKLGAEIQRKITEYNQQKDFIEKYGTRANIMQKLDHKLLVVGAEMDIKIADFDATIDFLKREFEFARNAREATQAAKDTMQFTEGWEVEYAMDVVASTIAEDIAITASNLTSIDQYTTMYNLDSDELYLKLEKLEKDISTGQEIIPDAKKYTNPEYELTFNDKTKVGSFGDIF